MGKLLKALTVFILLLSIGALVLGTFNFSKREVLIGRTHSLETKISQIALTLEEKEPVFEGVVAPRVELDIDEVSARQLMTPSTGNFWTSYNDNLEVVGTPRMNLGGEAAKQQLRTYYLLDAEGKVVKDFQGRPRTDGEGTMEELLNKVLENAENQLARLNATRVQLVKVREELEKVIGLLNEQKQLRRGNLRTISELEKKIGELEAEILSLNSDIKRLEREKMELEDVVKSRDQTIAQKDEEIVSLSVEVERLNNIIAKMGPADGTGGARLSSGEGGEVALTPGTKGEVISVNPEWAYVIIKLTPEAVAEITASEQFTPIELHVYRDSPEGSKIVTRLRLKNPPTADGIAIADNVYGWEQTPVQAGDDVVY